MAYSDYGGYAYRNGEQVEDRSDAVITPELTNVGAPGVWPGFVAVAQGASVEEFEKTRQKSVNGHVVLGDGPVLVAMYKQTSLSIYALKGGAFVEVDLLEAGVDLPEEAVAEYNGERYFSAYDLVEKGGGQVAFRVEGHTVEALFERSDNLYQFVRVTQPDGTIWTGFSGYGVGAGLEDCGYGFSTDDQISRLSEVFP